MYGSTCQGGWQITVPYEGGSRLSEFLQADIDSLRAMRTELYDTASVIEGVRHSETVSMPGSLVAVVASQSSEVVLAAYRRISDSIAHMAAATESNATSYEDLDAAFGEQLRRYEAGL